MSSSASRVVLGIETTCDETAAAVVLRSNHHSKVLSSVIATQHELHAEYAGVVPEIASRAHVERMVPTLRQAVRDAGVSLGELNLIAVADRPGLIGSLLVGVSAAKGLAWSLGLPVCGVHHVHAHLFAPLLESEKDLDQLLPAIGLAVSGGHTAMYAVHGPNPEDVRTVGATIDDALGEAFDKAATVLGLGHPGGPLLEQLAATGDARAHDFPISRLGRESTDFSFSGLKTAVLYAVRGLPQRGGVFERDHTALSHQQQADIAASFQRVAAAALSLKLERSLQAWEGERPVSLLAGGGVIANSAVRHAIQKVCAQAGLVPMLSPTKYCTDNAAMIAGLAALLPVPDQSMAMASPPRSTVARGTER